MCDGMKILNELKQQTNIKQSECNPYGECWCGHIDSIFPLPDYEDRCWTPIEILEQFSDELSVQDIIYLESIST